MKTGTRIPRRSAKKAIQIDKWLKMSEKDKKRSFLDMELKIAEDAASYATMALQRELERGQGLPRTPARLSKDLENARASVKKAHELIERLENEDFDDTDPDLEGLPELVSSSSSSWALQGEMPSDTASSTSSDMPTEGLQPKMASNEQCYVKLSYLEERMCNTDVEPSACSRHAQSAMSGERWGISKTHKQANMYARHAHEHDERRVTAVTAYMSRASASSGSEPSSSSSHCAEQGSSAAHEEDEPMAPEPFTVALAHEMKKWPENIMQGVTEELARESESPALAHIKSCLKKAIEYQKSLDTEMAEITEGLRNLELELD